MSGADFGPPVESREMVVSRGDVKRRRKEENVLVESIQGSPKRTKVHAQRKFAQGSSNMGSPALTPVKDKDKVKSNGTVLSPELIPTKRPKTEDFLTFLCFRGTPILPPCLDFFNIATVQDMQDEEQGSSMGDCSRESTRNNKLASAATGNRLQRSDRNLVDTAAGSGVIKKYDRSRNIERRKPPTAVQALRKKYQEQRLAKQRASNLKKLAQRVKGKNMVRTRSSTQTRELKAGVNAKQTKANIVKKTVRRVNIVQRKIRVTARRNLLTRKRTLVKIRTRRVSASIRRDGLRSGGQLPPGSEAGLKSERCLKQPSVQLQARFKPIMKKKPVVSDKITSKTFASSVSDFSSDDDQPLAKKIKPLDRASSSRQLARKVIKRIVTKRIKPRMITRSQQQHQKKKPNPEKEQLEQKIYTRPPRKTKEAAAIYMELLGRKLVAPEAEVDEDSLSIDSFPELPNAKRFERRESEIKAKATKEKKEKTQPIKEEVKTAPSTTEKLKTVADIISAKPKGIKIVKVKRLVRNKTVTVQKQVIKSVDKSGESVLVKRKASIIVSKTIATTEKSQRLKIIPRRLSLKSTPVEENETKQDDHDKMRPPSVPRRSLRRGSHDMSHRSPSSESSTADGISSKNVVKKVKNARASSSPSPQARPLRNVLKTQERSSSVEDKFSDSDEEPLGKIALKSTSFKQVEEGIKSQKEGGVSRKVGKSKENSGIVKKKIVVKQKIQGPELGLKKLSKLSSAKGKEGAVIKKDEVSSMRNKEMLKKTDEDTSKEVKTVESKKDKGSQEKNEESSKISLKRSTVTAKNKEVMLKKSEENEMNKELLQKKGESAHIRSKELEASPRKSNAETKSEKGTSKKMKDITGIKNKDSISKKRDVSPRKHEESCSSKDKTTVKGNEDTSKKKLAKSIEDRDFTVQKNENVSVKNEMVQKRNVSSDQKVILDNKTVKKETQRKADSSPVKEEMQRKESVTPDSKVSDRNIGENTKKNLVPYKEEKKVQDKLNEKKLKECLKKEENEEKKKKEIHKKTTSEKGDVKQKSIAEKITEDKSKENKKNEIIIIKNKTLAPGKKEATKDILDNKNEISMTKKLEEIKEVKEEEKKEILQNKSSDTIINKKELELKKDNVRKGNVQKKVDDKIRSKQENLKKEEFCTKKETAEEMNSKIKEEIAIKTKAEVSGKKKEDIDSKKKEDNSRKKKEEIDIKQKEGDYKKKEEIGCKKKEEMESKNDEETCSERKGEIVSKKKEEIDNKNEEEKDSKKSEVLIKKKEEINKKKEIIKKVVENIDINKIQQEKFERKENRNIKSDKNDTISSIKTNSTADDTVDVKVKEISNNKDLELLKRKENLEKAEENESVKKDYEKLSKKDILEDVKEVKLLGKIEMLCELPEMKKTDLDKTELIIKVKKDENEEGSSSNKSLTEKVEDENKSDLKKSIQIVKSECEEMRLEQKSTSFESKTVSEVSCKIVDSGVKEGSAVKTQLVAPTTCNKVIDLEKPLTESKILQKTASVLPSVSSQILPKQPRFGANVSNLALLSSDSPKQITSHVKPLSSILMKQNAQVRKLPDVSLMRQSRLESAATSASSRISNQTTKPIYADTSSESFSPHKSIPVKRELVYRDKRKVKAKVNMSNEQIEKWLNESCIVEADPKKEEKDEQETSLQKNKDQIESVIPDDRIKIPAIPPVQYKEVPVNQMYKSSEKSSAFRVEELQQKLVKMSQVSIGLKADPPIEQKPVTKELKTSSSSTREVHLNEVKEITSNVEVQGTRTQTNRLGNTSGNISSNISQRKQAREDLNISGSSTECLGEEKLYSETKKLEIPMSPKSQDRSAEKKLIFQRRSFPLKVKERKDLTPSASAFSPENESSVYAFESEPELPPMSTPFRRRARDSRTSSTTTSKSEEDLARLDDEITPPSTTATTPCAPPPSALSVVQQERLPLPVVGQTIQTLPLATAVVQIIPTLPITMRSVQMESLVPTQSQQAPQQQLLLLQNDAVMTTLKTGSTSSTSIAVQVNLDNEPSLDASSQNMVTPDLTIPEPLLQKSMECSTQTDVADDEDDGEGHLFYIPLQQSPVSGGVLTAPSQQLIQGVAVKLGTEGPTGPNQRVIMRAKLVTKPPNFNRTTGAQDGSNLGIGRSVLTAQHQRPAGMLMMDQKNIYTPSSTSTTGTYPPVGTVQPTARGRPLTIPAVNQTKNDATTDTLSSIAELDTAKGTSPPSVKAVDISSGLYGQSQEDNMLKKPLAMVPAKPVLSSTATSVKDQKIANREAASTSPQATVPAHKVTVTKERRGSSEVSTPSTSSTPAAKVGVTATKRNSHKSKNPAYICKPTNNTAFPSSSSPAKMVEAPIFHPTEKEFQDPLEYIDRIRPVAEKFGLCRVVPPSNFKPECKVTDDMRFLAYNQYVHKMLHRWGPNVKEMMAIKKYLATQSISLNHPPWIGGMEVDLPRLYKIVQGLGGLKEVIEKKKWHRVADGMKIPKSAQDRVTKLDDIYCKYLLPYDTLSPVERQKLFDEVEKEWLEREKKTAARVNPGGSEVPEDECDGDTTDELEECIFKGRNMPLNAFYRIARNTMSMWFRQAEPPAAEVEQEFWRHVTSRQSHVCVHSGSIDSSGWGYGFPCSKNSPFARHPWNLKVLTNNSGSILRSIGPIMGVTVPTLHVGMVFTTCCWYRDPHGLPWIEYLHTGANKIWYGIPDEHSLVFRSALAKLVPQYCKNKTIWLPSDTAMVPPPLLVKHGVPLCHTVQEPGQFILVFPRAFTSSICTGYLVSESVYFAQSNWLNSAEQVFKDIQNSCEPSMFSLERLLFSIATDGRAHVEVLKQVLPMVLQIRQRELEHRKQLYALGLKTSERLPLPEANMKRRKARQAREEEGDYECEMCRANLFVSLVTNSHEEGVYCLPHAIELLTKKKHHLKYCKLIYTYDQAELNELIQKLQEKIETKSQKKSQSRHQLK